MTNRMAIRITALLTMLAVLIFALPQNVVLAEETESQPTTESQSTTENTTQTQYSKSGMVQLETKDAYDQFKGTVGNTTAVFVAVGRGMTITAFGNKKVTKDTQLQLPEQSSSVASIQLVEETTTVATGGQTKSYGIRIRGLNTGNTTFQVDGVTFTLHLVPNNPSWQQNSKYIKVAVDQVTNSKAYVSINGSELFEITTGMAIDQTFVGGCGLLFFTAPNDGYALTAMGATNSMGQYYALGDGIKGDGTDTEAWPYKTVTDENGNSFEQLDEAHGFKNAIDTHSVTKEELQDLFTRAIKAGCDGTILFTRSSGSDLETRLSFISKKLPEIFVSLTYREKNSEQWNSLKDDAVLSIGDVLRYEMQIITYDISAMDMTFSNIELKNSLINFYLSSQSGNEDEKIDVDKLLTGGKYTHEYTLSEADIQKYAGGKVTNISTLSYSYKSDFSKGVFQGTNTFSVHCYVKGLVSFDWSENTPEYIKNNYELPPVSIINTTEEFEIRWMDYQQFNKTETGQYGEQYVVAHYDFLHWVWKDKAGATQSAENGATIPATNAANFGDSVVFYAVWNETPCQTYSVTYEHDGVPNIGTSDNNRYYAGQYFLIDSYYSVGSIEMQQENGQMVDYVFRGWKLKDGTAVDQEKYLMTEGGITIVGTWVEAVSLTIQVSGAGEAGQTFLFRVSGNGVDLTLPVTVSMGEDGLCAGSATIYGLMKDGTYTVEALNWMWRYETVWGTENSTSVKLQDNVSIVNVNYSDVKGNSKWLDHCDSYAVFTKKKQGEENQNG